MTSKIAEEQRDKGICIPELEYNSTCRKAPNQTRIIINMWETVGTLSCGWLAEGYMQLFEEAGNVMV